MHDVAAEAAPEPHYAVMTESQLKGLLARWAIGTIGSALMGAALILLWASKLEAKVDANEKRIEEIRVEGSLPVQSLKTQMEVLSVQLRAVSEQLQRMENAR